MRNFMNSVHDEREEKRWQGHKKCKASFRTFYEMPRRGSWMHKGGKHADSRRTHAEKSQPKQQVRTPAAFILPHDGCISGNQDNDEDQGNRHHAIDHGGIDQSFDRINPDEVEQQSNDGCHRDDAIKPPRLGEFLVQSLSPLQAL